MASKHLVRGIGEVKEPIYEFEWKIPNFVSLPEELYFSSSLSFPFVGTSWNFYIFPNGTPESPGFVSMGLRKKPTVPPVILNVSFAFKTLDGKKVLERKNAHHLFRDGFDYYTSIRYISRRDLLKKASEFLPSNVLTIICYVKFLEVTEDANDGSLIQDLKKMLSDGKNHDLILKIGNKELRAHQDILRARSHVFEAMLNHDMKEKNSGIIDVSDCDPKAMELFLLYIYTGKVETLQQSDMLGLYYIADKYDMQCLKKECCNFIKNSLSHTNICEIIQLAVNHSDSGILEYATEYFMDNALDIMITVEWQSFLKENVTLGNELFIKSFKKVKRC